MTADPGRRLRIAGVSVRAATEAARRDGFEVLAIDRFGDLDTRAAAGAGWQALASDPAEALPGADRPLLVGAGFEAPAQLERLRRPGVRLLGTAPDDVARLRDPEIFFLTLGVLGVPHPPVRLSAPPPSSARLWLRKDLHGCGGEQVLPADAPEAGGATPGGFWQRRVDAARPVSLTLIGDGRRAALLGLNRQRVHPAPPWRWRFGGLIGPLPLRPAEGAALQALADRLVDAFGLRGLCSIDALQPADGGALQVLEINARLPASLALYGREGGLIRAHVEACRDGRLPDAAALARLAGGAPGGWEIVRAPTALALDARAIERLAAQAAALGLHDLPAAPQRLAAGEPLCSVGVAPAAGAGAAAVRRQLALRARAALAFLNPSS